MISHCEHFGANRDTSHEKSTAEHRMEVLRVIVTRDAHFSRNGRGQLHCEAAEEACGCQGAGKFRRGPATPRVGSSRALASLLVVLSLLIRRHCIGFFLELAMQVRKPSIRHQPRRFSLCDMGEEAQWVIGCGALCLPCEPKQQKHRPRLTPNGTATGANLSQKQNWGHMPSAQSEEHSAMTKMKKGASTHLHVLATPASHTEDGAAAAFLGAW